MPRNDHIATGEAGYIGNLPQRTSHDAFGYNAMPNFSRQDRPPSYQPFTSAAIPPPGYQVSNSSISSNSRPGIGQFGSAGPLTVS